MMADQVDSLSDAQLRTKLAEHGFPVMPITASTRKLLVKKLKMVLDNKTKPRNSVDNKDSRRSLAKYSSGEESDVDVGKERRTRRTTGSMLPPVARTRRVTPKKDSPKKDSPKKTNDRDSDSDNERGIRSREVVETVTTRRVTRNVVKDREDYETGSDSDIDEKHSSKSFRSSSQSSDHISSTLPVTEPKTSIFSRPSLSTTDYASSSDHLNAMRSRLGLSTTFDRPAATFDRPASTFDRPASTFDRPASTYTSTRSSYPTTSAEEVESPYLSSFTRRLTSLSAESPRTSVLDREPPNNGTLFPRRSYISGISRPDLDKISNDKKVFRSNLVSLGLLAIVSLFFVGVFFLYVVKKNDISSLMDDQNSLIPICQTNIHGNRPGINCVPKDQVPYAKDLLKLIHPELTKRTANYKCGDSNVMPYLTDREVLDIANVRAETVGHPQRRVDLNNLQVLIVNNPQWGLNVVQLKSLYSKNVDYETLTSAEDVARQRTAGTIAISQVDPTTPFSCLAASTLTNAILTITATSILIGTGISIYKLYQYYMTYRKKKNDEIYSMVAQIVDTISQETEDSGEPYISIDHVRDSLISPHNREKMASIWDAAVKFIQKNESRVRMEVQSVNGEDCKVWRWVSVGSPRRSGNWQGQAFETQEGSVNNLPVSPTPCLKIRHMFEKNDTNPNLLSIIQDAILEKCGTQCNILHMDMDHASCCVYVKCMSPKDAGVVYRSLHGWWFRNNLITVKYLRLERYMQRFPDSPSAGPFLMPSSQKHTWDE